jgi:large subunit ribosomal protein L32
MAPLPKRRMSSMRTGKRRQGIFLKATNVTPCPNCGKPKLSHTVCKECGVYADRVVVPPKIRTTVKKLTKNNGDGQGAQSS